MGRKYWQEVPKDQWLKESQWLLIILTQVLIINVQQMESIRIKIRVFSHQQLVRNKEMEDHLIHLTNWQSNRLVIQTRHRTFQALGIWASVILLEHRQVAHPWAIGRVQLVLQMACSNNKQSNDKLPCQPKINRLVKPTYPQTLSNNRMKALLFSNQLLNNNWYKHQKKSIYLKQKIKS